MIRPDRSQPINADVHPRGEYDAAPPPPLLSPRQPAHEFLALSVFSTAPAPDRRQDPAGCRRTDPRRRKWRIGDFP